MSSVTARRKPSGAHEIEFNAVEVTMLSQAAKRHFKLFRDPFETEPEGPEDVFLGPDQLWALAAMEDAIKHNRMFALVGESGSGKTTLLDLLRDRIRREPAEHPYRLIQPMVPNKARLTERDILVSIVIDLGDAKAIKQNKERLTRAAQELLGRIVEQKQHNVLLFEEAHDMSIEGIKLLKRFHEFKDEWKKLMSIILVGQPELLAKVGENGPIEAREVARRLERVTLLPLGAEVRPYVEHRLTRIGAAPSALLNDDAWPAVVERLRGDARDGNGNTARVSMCYPLLVNNLMTKALNVAAELGAAKIDAAIVRGC